MQTETDDQNISAYRTVLLALLLFLFSYQLGLSSANLSMEYWAIQRRTVGRTAPLLIA